MAEANVLCAVVAGLGVLMKKKQTGCGSSYGIDILEIAFDNMRDASSRISNP